MEIEKCEKLVCNLYDKKNSIYTYKRPEWGIRSWIETKKKKKQQGKRVFSRNMSMSETVYRYGNGADEKNPEITMKKTFSS